MPVVNENDAVADDEIRFGDNDRLAALVAHLVGAGLLVLLTDTPGLLSADPRLDPSASLIEEIVEVDHALEALAGGPGTAGGSGGMASKIAAAKIAAWSGVRTVIAAARRDDVLADAVAGAPGVGTVVLPHDRDLPARKLWIASPSAPPAPWSSTPEPAVPSKAGACASARRRTAVHGRFDVDDAVEITDGDGTVFAKGLVRTARPDRRADGRPAQRRPPRRPPGPLVHADDLVVLP